MKSVSASALLGALLAAKSAAIPAPVVDELYPYTGPEVPVGDWVDPTVNGNGKGFERLIEAPAVKPASSKPTNNINVISLSYTANGINIHYQTPFGLGEAPSIRWGTSASRLTNKATGSSTTYDRTPPCSAVTNVTQCSQHFHDVHLSNLKAGKTYYYKITAANGTTASDVLSFKTAAAAGDSGEFSVAVLNDMGYTNAAGSYTQLNKLVKEGAAFAWHGGDLSYADDWYLGVIPCDSSNDVCYNGTASTLPGGVVSEDYKKPLPDGEVANQGSPRGGDMSVLYETNWDIWQQWINTITTKVPYMVLPGNHEAACAGASNKILTAYLNENKSNASASEANVNYYSCPPSQRNFTAYQNRFHMAGEESGGVGNFWYSFDYGLAHFVSINAETDYANSPEAPFAMDLSGNEVHPLANETYVRDSGPFGTVGNYSDTKTYQQYHWLLKDLASVDRKKTPWLIIGGHRPMYSSQVSDYQAYMRDAFESLFLKYEVDLYISGHIHWYERMTPMARNGTIDTASMVNNNTYTANPGVSITHIVNGAAGNIQSHSELGTDPLLNISQVLDAENFGVGKLTVHSAKKLSWKYIHGETGAVGDELTLLKN